MFCLFGSKRLLADRKSLGRWGEKRCEKYLKKKGYKTLARNFLCKTGEIDLVMADAGGTIVFVEVKTRADEDYAPAEDSVTLAKKAKLYRAARYFLQTQNIKNQPCRFDAVTIVLRPKGREQIRHYENVFSP